MALNLNILPQFFQAKKYVIIFEPSKGETGIRFITTAKINRHI